MSSSPRVAVVTGAASGIGLVVGTQFAKDGLITVLLDRSDKVLEIARQLGNRAEGMVIDVAQESEISQAMQGIDKRHGRCDILVNNAGIHPKNKGRKQTIEDMTPAQWQEVMAINLAASFLFCRLALPLMRMQRWGRIINISSRGGRTASPVASTAYAATKAGLIGFTRIAALKGAPGNITANCIAPGSIKSATTAGSAPEVIEAFIRSVPLGRYGEPEDGAAAVAFLPSDASSFITGAVFDVNGGTFMP